MKKLLILSIYIFLSSFAMHKYYVSVTEITYKKDSHKLEIIMRIFPDDIENVIHDEYEIEADLSKQETKEFLYRYIYEKFHLWTGEEELAYEILGTTQEDDFFIILLQAKTPNDLHEIIVKNTVLQDMFEVQKNLIHFFKDNQKQSFILEKSNPEATISF